MFISDSGNNGLIEYTWTPVTFGSDSYFHMSAKGAVLLTVYPSNHMQYGDVHRFTITATDKGSPALSTTCVLDIMYRVGEHYIFLFELSIDTRKTIIAFNMRVK